jgi:tetratricopeptide (TPR) repeat protein
MSQQRTISGRRPVLVWFSILIVLILLVAVLIIILFIYPNYQRQQQMEQHYQAGIAFQNVEDWDKALAEFEQAIRIDGTYKDVQTRLAEVKAKQQEVLATAQAKAAQATATAEARAKTIATTATAEALAQLEATYQKCLGAISLGRWAEAQTACDQVFAVDPNYKDVQTKLAEIEAKLAVLSAPTSTPTHTPSLTPTVTPTPSSRPTFTKQPTAAHTPHPTATPLPTNTPQPTKTPTITPLQTATNTPTPDPRLAVGETWKQEGVWLTLERAQFQADGNIIFDLKLENHTGDTIAFSWDADNLRLVDNLGHEYGQPWCNRDKAVLKAEDSYRLHSCNWGRGLYFSGEEFFNQSVTDMTLTVQGLSRITLAQWHIAVPH